MKTLIVEDEVELANYLRMVLEKEDNEVTVCDSIEEVKKNGHEYCHDLIILDLMLKGKRGEHLVADLRRENSNVPILVLSALGQISTKIDLINLGADDYLTKPFHAEELKARMKSLYRRYLQIGFKDKECFGDFVYFRKQNRIKRGKKEITLTKREVELFELLLRHRGKNVPIQDIIDKVWKAKRGCHSNVVQSTVRRLRNKVDKGFKHKLIRNIHGVGYKLVLPDIK